MAKRRKTADIDILLKKTRTKTYSVDVRIIRVVNSSIDVFIKKNSTTVNHNVESVISKALVTKTHGIDVYIGKRNIYSLDTHIIKPWAKYDVDALQKKTSTKTHLMTVMMANPKTVWTRFEVLIPDRPALTYSLDVIVQSGLRSVSHNVATILLRTKAAKTYSVDSYLIGPATSSVSSVGVFDGALDTALASAVIQPTARLSRILNRNMVLENEPEITASDAGNGNGNFSTSLIDGYDRSSMKWAFADSDATTNDDYRIFPDLDKFESDKYIHRQKVPWISSVACDSNGNFADPLIFTIEYTGTNEFNMVQVVTDQFGKANAGVITNATIEASYDGITWETIGHDLSGFDGLEFHRLQIFYYYDTTVGNYLWTQDRGHFIEQADAASTTYVVSYAFIRVTINSIAVNTQEIPAYMPRLAQLYEVGAYLYDVGMKEVNLTSVSIQEQRDLATQTLSPIGASSANTLSATGTLAGTATPYFAHYGNPFSADHDKYVGAVYQVDIGIKLDENNTSYIDYGTFLADDISISGPDGRLNISARDYSRVLQETKMPDMVYVDMTLDVIIRDIIERAGIEYWSIDDTQYTLHDLQPDYFDEFYSNEDVERTYESNVIWTQNQTCWEFLQSIAYADLGAFYFDRLNQFVYKSKENLLRGADPQDWTLTEENDIFSFNNRNEIMKNAYTINYRVPRRTKKPVGIWDAPPSLLGATALAQDIDSEVTTVPVGDVQDWYRTGYIQVGNEIIRYKDRDDKNFLDCDRGWLGTKASAHAVTNDYSNWNFGSSTGNWLIEGGVMTATSNGGVWDTALTASTHGGNSYNFYGTVTINSDPWAAGMIVLAQNSNNHYRLVWYAEKLGNIYDGLTATGSPNGNMYEIYEVSGGTPHLLKGIPWNKAKRRVRSTIPYRVQVQVNSDEISLFIKGTKVLNYTIKDTDLNIDTPAKVGFAAKGSGPTVFENAAMTSLPEDKGGETILWTDPFGKPVREIRKFEATYSPVGEGEQSASPPCWGIRYYITNVNMLSVILFDPGPFSASAYVRNDVDFPYTLISGKADEDSVPEYFYMTGYALQTDLEQKHVDYEDEGMITRYGRQELVADLPWVESATHAHKLLKYLRHVYSKPTVFLNMKIRPEPRMELGDIVLVNSTNQIWFPEGTETKFYVVGNSVTIDGSGLSQTLDLRSVTYSDDNTGAITGDTGLNGNPNDNPIAPEDQDPLAGGY